MLSVMRKTLSLKVRRYVACLVDPNESLALLPGEELTGKFGVTELFFFNSTPNSCSKQLYVQVFGCKFINLKVC